MPHRVFGLFEVKDDGDERFIINPWLEKSFRENLQFDAQKGVYINQDNFKEYAEYLNYGAFILQSEGERCIKHSGMGY